MVPVLTADAAVSSVGRGEKKVGLPLRRLPRKPVTRQGADAVFFELGASAVARWIADGSAHAAAGCRKTISVVVGSTRVCVDTRLPAGRVAAPSYSSPA